MGAGVPRIPLFAAAVSLAFSGLFVAQAQDSRAVVEAQAKRTKVDGEEVIRVDIQVKNVVDLGAFEFILTFDGSLLSVDPDSIEEGPFLGSSGRQTYCQAPSVDSNALRYACVTLGDTPRQGAEGDGLLASVFFHPKGDGKATIEFTRAQLATPPGDSIPADWQAGEIAVRSGRGLPWWGWLLAAVGGVAALGLIGGTVAAVIARRGAPTGVSV